MLRVLALVLTALTGFSGLVYEVAWEAVLASLLGSHSEATAAVLGLFLGGLSVGYAWFGHLAHRRSLAAARGGKARSLLTLYGIVECTIGCLALLFPWSFAAIQSLSLALPPVPLATGFAIDVGLAALLVFFPAVLMGGTIPLLTQGLANRLDEATRLHSLVYAVNTAGAFAGALAAAFLLIPELGLYVTIRAMGGINLVAGSTFVVLGLWEVARRKQAAEPRGDADRTREASADATHPIAVMPGERLAPYAWVALLSGFAMMALQTTLNRIGALALGASQFTFAMVVAAFVLCIALGSLAVALLPRVHRSYVGLSQWLLVFYLVILYPAVENAPYWAHVVQLQWGDGAGIVAFYLGVFCLLLAILSVPLGLSGALLPLLFHHLRRDAVALGHVAGRLYSWNTVGSLIGALAGGYMLLFWIDMHAVYRLAVVALAIGAAILTPRVGLAGRAAAVLALAGVVAIVALQPPWDPVRLSAGLFRAQLAREQLAAGPDEFFASRVSHGMGDRVLFYTDDPSTSVAVYEMGPEDAPTGRSVVVNGKSDGNIPADNITTGLLALLPALFAERCERAFVIGLGTGMSVGELAALDSTREVVVAEISTGVIEATALFESVNRGALHNAKTRVVRGDAYRALLRDPAHYDVIVSEPSNPWVAGVEMLYSVEFLRAARQRLSQGGVYAQWFHTYETDDTSLQLVLRSFDEAFEHVAVWNGDASDLVILGFTRPDRALDVVALRRRFVRPDFERQFGALGLSFPRLLAHEQLPFGVVAGLDLGGVVHTLAHPRLSDTAARAFYRHSQTGAPSGLGHVAAEAGARNSLLRLWRRDSEFGEEERLELLRETCALDLRACATHFAHWLHEQPDSPRLADTLERARRDARLASALQPALLERLAALFDPTVPGPDATTTVDFASASNLRGIYATYYAHAAPFDPAALHMAWQSCARTDPRCARELPVIRGLGASDAAFHVGPLPAPAERRVSDRPLTKTSSVASRSAVPTPATSSMQRWIGGVVGTGGAGGSPWAQAAPATRHR